MDYRARRELLWDATDGISKATKALERLSLDYKHKGSEEAWDDALVLWEAILSLTAKHTEARRAEDA